MTTILTEIDMYKKTVRALVRHGIRRLDDGDPSFLLRLAHRDAELAFPGENSLAAMYRPVVKGPTAHVTHSGRDELAGFAERYVELGLRFHVDDILVNGGPWRTRVAVRGRMQIPGPPEGPDDYQNRIVAMITITWGRMTAWEDYEDTERISTWEAIHGGVRAEPLRAAAGGTSSR